MKEYETDLARLELRRTIQLSRPKTFTDTLVTILEFQTSRTSFSSHIKSMAIVHFRLKRKYSVLEVTPKYSRERCWNCDVLWDVNVTKRLTNHLKIGRYPQRIENSANYEDTQGETENNSVSRPYASFHKQVVTSNWLPRFRFQKEVPQSGGSGTPAVESRGDYFVTD